MNIDLRNTDLRIVTRRVHSAVAPLSERDRRVVERLARRTASDPDAIREDRQSLGRRFAERVVSMIAALPGVTIATGRNRPATGRERQAGSGDAPRAAANEDRPSLRAA